MVVQESLQTSAPKKLDAGDIRIRVRSGPLGAVLLLALLSYKCRAYLTAVAVVSFMLFWHFGGLFPVLVYPVVSWYFLYHAQDDLLYHPLEPKNSRTNVQMPPEKVPHESLSVRSMDGTQLHMLLIRQAEPLGSSCPTMLILHGNAGNIGHGLDHAGELYSALQINVLLVDYRGYGLSKGRPSEQGLYMDGSTALNYLHTRSDINHSQIIMFGRSLGGAVAIEVASKSENAGKIWCLILENTFTSVPEMAGELLGPWISLIPTVFYKNKFCTIQKIGKVTVPTLFLSGMSDALVPPEMMVVLSRECGSTMKTLIRFPGGTHNDTWLCYKYYEIIVNFLDTVRQRWKGESSERSAEIVIPVIESTLLSKIHHV